MRRMIRTTGTAVVGVPGRVVEDETRVVVSQNGRRNRSLAI